MGGLNPGPLNHHSNALTDCARQVCVWQEMYEVSFNSCTTSHFELSVEYWHDDQEVLGSITTGGNLLFCSTLPMLAGFYQNLAEKDEL